VLQQLLSHLEEVRVVGCVARERLGQQRCARGAQHRAHPLRGRTVCTWACSKQNAL